MIRVGAPTQSPARSSADSLGIPPSARRLLVAPQSPHALRRQLPTASPWAERIYHDARTRGCRHPHAIRILARAWLRVIWACWHTNTPYDPTRHRGHDRHLQDLTLT